MTAERTRVNSGNWDPWWEIKVGVLFFGWGIVEELSRRGRKRKWKERPYINKLFYAQGPRCGKYFSIWRTCPVSHLDVDKRWLKFEDTMETEKETSKVARLNICGGVPCYHFCHLRREKKARQANDRKSENTYWRAFTCTRSLVKRKRERTWSHPSLTLWKRSWCEVNEKGRGEENRSLPILARTRPLTKYSRMDGHWAPFHRHLRSIRDDAVKKNKKRDLRLKKECICLIISLSYSVHHVHWNNCVVTYTAYKKWIGENDCEKEK